MKKYYFEATVLRVLAVIPARGGSKRLPRKNILSLGGKPLIAYSIEAARKSKLLCDHIVSSEDEEIISVAKSCGGNVPFVRPDSLAGDSIRNSDNLIHALEWYEAKNKEIVDAIILLQPTAPLRQSWHIDHSIELFRNNPGADTLASVTGPYKKRDIIIKSLRDDGTLVNYCSSDKNTGFYKYNASIYIVRREYLLKEKKFTSAKEIGYVMDDIYSADIDNEIDFERALSDLKFLRKRKLCEN